MSARSGKIAALAFAIVLGVGTGARADEPPPKPPRVELRHDVWIDGAVTTGMIAGLLSWSVVRNDVIGETCGICDGPGTSVNGLDAWFRDNLKRRDVQPARTISDILSYGVGPLSILTLATVAAADHGYARDIPIDLLLLLEGMMSSLVVSEALKPITLRERPDYHALDPDARERYPKQDEPLLSFPSGHGGTILGMTFAAGTIASTRGYRLAPLIWASGILLSTATSYMRIAADRHYFTDVLGGWAIGAVMGGGIPWLFHGPDRRASTIGALGVLRSGHIGSQGVLGGRLFTLTWAY